MEYYRSCPCFICPILDNEPIEEGQHPDRRDIYIPDDLGFIGFCCPKSLFYKTLHGEGKKRDERKHPSFK